MPESEQKAADVIEAYRRRRERTVPLLLGGLAVVLLVIGIFLVWVWLSGGESRIFSAIFSRDTATPTSTPTARLPTDTPSPTNTLAPTETPTPTPPMTYIVEENDTLSSIAEMFEVDMYVLMAYNDIRDANAIQVGQELIIPQPDSELPTPTPLPSTLQPGQEIEYLVMPGDILATIAAKFNSTPEAIADRNGIEDPNQIFAGMRLIIPVNIVTPVPTDTPGPGTPTATPES
ncbi:MAG: LysM domain-containing protein [Anaerolineales bacterium]|jgi:LysM repeat protein